jgi:hypothetical protein
VLLEAHIFPPKWFYLYIFLSLVVEKKKKTQNYFKFMKNEDWRVLSQYSVAYWAEVYHSHSQIKGTRTY